MSGLKIENLHAGIETTPILKGVSLEVPRGEVERMADGSVHQGIALTVPAYEYLHPDDLLEAARQAAHLARTEPLLVALDGVTDPRNLGAVIRSAAAFGAHGILLPLRRSVGVRATICGARSG